MQELYVSTDVESDGPIPGIHSMLSFGSAVFTADKLMVSTFSANLETLPGATQDRSTMEWWATQPEAWEAHRKELEKPAVAMGRYWAWLKSFNDPIVFLAYPIAFDWKYIDYYLLRFCGDNPFGFEGLDVKSYINGMRPNKLFTKLSKKNFPKRWFNDVPNNKAHVALDDAIEQGYMFLNIMAENKAKE